MDKIACLLIVFFAGMAHAATPVNCSVQWDYPSPVPRLGSFFVYVSSQSGVYPIAGKPLDSRPRVILSAYPTMVLTVSCAALKLTGAGPWYVVVTAVSVDMTEESAYTNEVVIGGDGVPPKPPPVLPVRPPPVVVLPPPLPWSPKPVTPFPQPPSGGGSRLTETETWRGVGATPSPPLRQDVPGAPERPSGKDRLTDTPTWQGR